MNKRGFLSAAGSAFLGLMFGPSLLAQYATRPVGAVAEDEAFWAAVRGQFRLTNDYINLENGYYCFQPQPVLDAFIDQVRAINLEASHYMRTRQVDDKLRIRGRLAAFAGCSPEELIITRTRWRYSKIKSYRHASRAHRSDHRAISRIPRDAW